MQVGDIAWRSHVVTTKAGADEAVPRDRAYPLLPSRLNTR